MHVRCKGQRWVGTCGSLTRNLFIASYNREFPNKYISPHISSLSLSLVTLWTKYIYFFHSDRQPKTQISSEISERESMRRRKNYIELLVEKSPQEEEAENEREAWSPQSSQKTLVFRNAEKGK